jgi:nucleotide-binding universal stress UspA family protein
MPHCDNIREDIIMKSFKRILCHVDFSKASIQALHVARDLAVRSRGELYVLHVVKHISALTMDASVPKVLVREANIELTTLLNKHIQHGLKHEGKIIYDDPVHEIVTYVKKHKIDILVIPTHETGGFHSIKKKILDLIDCPVLMIPTKIRKASK